MGWSMARAIGDQVSIVADGEARHAHVIDLRVELSGSTPSSSLRVRFVDDGSSRWLPVDAPEILQLPVQHDGFGGAGFELKCALSHQRLHNPAKGTHCTHVARCNYDELRAYAGRQKLCPIFGCGAAIARTHDVKRDDALRVQIERLPSCDRAILGDDGQLRAATSATLESLDKGDDDDDEADNVVPHAATGHLHDDVYEVERLLARRKTRGRIEYLVRWTGWTREYDSWEDAEWIDDSAIAEYEGHESDVNDDEEYSEEDSEEEYADDVVEEAVMEATEDSPPSRKQTGQALGSAERMKIMRLLDVRDSGRGDLTFSKIARRTGRSVGTIRKLLKERDAQDCARVVGSDGHLHTVCAPVAGKQGGFRWCSLSNEQKQRCMGIAQDNPKLTMTQVHSQLLELDPTCTASYSSIYRFLSANVPKERSKKAEVVPPKITLVKCARVIRRLGPEGIKALERVWTEAGKGAGRFSERLKYIAATIDDQTTP